MRKIGLTLSGGGARGFAHLGAIKALEEHGIKPTIISGTSAGALIGAFYAAGYSIDTIISISKRVDFFSLKHLLIRKAGIFNMDSFEKLIKEHIPENTFESLSIPLIVAASDIVKGEPYYFSAGTLSKAIMASACIPMVYEPVKYNNKIFLDGGLLDNFPVETIRDKCDFLIGVYVNEMSTKIEHLHMKDLLDRSFHLALSSSIKEKMKNCDLYISPKEMSRFGIFDIAKIDEIIEFGYNYSIKLLKNSEIFKKT